MQELKSRGGERGTRAELDTMRRELEGLRSEGGIWAAKLADSSAVAGRAQAELRDRLTQALADKGAADATAAESAANAAALVAQLAAAQSALEAERAKCDALTSQLGTYSAAAASAEQAASDARAQAVELTRSLGQAREALATSQAQVSAGEAALGEARAAAKAASDRAAGASAKAAALEAQVAAARAAAAQAQVGEQGCSGRRAQQVVRGAQECCFMRGFETCSWQGACLLVKAAPSSRLLVVQLRQPLPEPWLSLRWRAAGGGEPSARWLGG
jgi:chromosome segregation ATPase